MAATELVVVGAMVGAAALLLALAVRRRRIRGRRGAHPAAGEPVTESASAGRVAGRPGADPEEIERALTERVLAGRLDSTGYQSGMADVAASVQDDASGTDARIVLILGSGSPRLLAKLGTALPELPLTTVRAAVGLTRYGADPDQLVRLLGLTGAQALRIATSAARSSGHRQDGPALQ